MPFDPDHPYLIGIFLVGAYQEILGDMHNLFGNINTLLVKSNSNGSYELVNVMEGDTVESSLKHVNFSGDELLKSYKQLLANAKLPAKDCDVFLDDLSIGLQGYTYFED
jgi:arginine decarboxylase